MNKKDTETDFFNFDVCYDTDREKNRTLNTECIISKKDRQIEQLYTGLYFQKSYHNIGRFKWYDGNDEYVYEGKLYANDLHGYGRLIYPDQSSFEGLFDHNKRFGPGVVTYPNQLQDVGYWVGKHLVRISQSIELDDFYLENIPVIGKSVEGKLYLLRFKEVIPLIKKENPVAALAKEFKLKANHCEQLYSKCIRNHKSIFFNRTMYDENFYTDPRELIDEVFDHLDKNNVPVTNRINVTNLLAWNNDPLYIEIMKHTYINRKYEKILSYKVRNAILPNRRDTFLPEGPIEEMSLKLLSACCYDDTLTITKLISDYDLYPNVCDCHGNTTIIYAAMSNKINAIQTLVKFGANLNSVNDECISALVLCILNYIAIKNDTLESNWEEAFLQLETDFFCGVEGRIWPTKETNSSSDNSITSRVTKAALIKGKRFRRRRRKKIVANRVINRKYIFDLIYKAPPKRSLSRRLQLLRRLKDFRKLRATIKCDKKEALQRVMNTIKVLLQSGIDINACAVPYPPLISSLFSDNIEMVRLMLQYKADVNKTTTMESGSLNPLHIICAMDKNSNQTTLVNMLLKHGVDINARSNMAHWAGARDKLLAGDPVLDEFSPMGKTPMHVLAMRYDFEDDTENNIVRIAKLLIDAGANPNAEYLGHNALSLAILRGNLVLAEYILGNEAVNPNKNIGNNMGAPLTMLTLEKYSELVTELGPEKVEEMMELLIKYHANPFNDIDDFDGNALEFAMANNNMDEETEAGGLLSLFKVAAAVLRRYVRSRALQTILQNFELSQNNPLARNIVGYLNVPRAVNIMQILLKHKIIVPNFVLCTKVLKYIHALNGYGKLNVELVDPRESNLPKQKTIRAKRYGIVKTMIEIKLKNKVYRIDFDPDNDETPIGGHFENIPEIDQDHEKYKVCYSCLQKQNKVLQLCPLCNLVYFCCINCNIRENESGEHPCKEIYYIGGPPRHTKGKKKAKKITHILFQNMFDSEYESDSTSSEEDIQAMNKKQRRRRFSKKRIWYTYDPYKSPATKKDSCISIIGTQIAIEFKEPIADMLKGLRRIYKRPELQKYRHTSWPHTVKCKIVLSEKNINAMLYKAKRVNLQLIPVNDKPINPCDPFDYKFWQLFLPYCVFQDGDLYYRATESDILYKLPYTYT